MMSMKDGALLDWFFGQGVSAFERSTFGPQLERAEFYLVPWSELRKPVTARPTAEYIPHGGVEPDFRLLVRYGEASRRLKRVAEIDPAAVGVLSTFHGDSGIAWGRHERGRYVSLFRMTKHGRKLIERARKRAKGAQLEVSDADRLRSEVELDLIQPRADPVRKTLITLAQIEAQQLYGAACKVWNRTPP